MKITKALEKTLLKTAKSKTGFATKEELIEAAKASEEQTDVLALSVLIDIRDTIAESLVAGAPLASLNVSVKAISDRIALQS